MGTDDKTFLPKKVAAAATALIAALAAFVLATTTLAASPDEAQAASSSETQTMYRLYNPNSGEHFYTASAGERDSVQASGWNYEGEAWTAPVKSDTPVYRLYSGTDHHYTTSAAERDMLVGVGWSDEGTGWYSDDAKGVPLYRQFNPNVDPNASYNNSGSHNYTTSKGENDHLVSLGWIAEDIGWYGVDTSKTDADDSQQPDSSGSDSTNPDTANPDDTNQDITDHDNADSDVTNPDITDSNDDDSGDITNPDSDVPTDDTPIEDVPVVSEEQQAIENVKQYSYEVRTVNGNLNNILFVETNNPDPSSFQLVDESSSYLGEDETAIFKPLEKRYSDVAYSDESTGRISDIGYLFYCKECTSDGGNLSLMANIGYSESQEGNVSYSVAGTNYATGISIPCQSLMDSIDYLIQTYADGQSEFFDKLSAVNAGLSGIAIYPKSVIDTNKPNTSGRCYPFLATSLYPEAELNEHVSTMYEYDDPLFLDAAYGFTLDSLYFPGMISSVAKRLQPSCTVESGSAHHLVKVTYDGQSKTFGGAGAGSSNPIYSKFIANTFKFDGTDIGFGTNPSMETMKEARLHYAADSDQFAQDALDQLSPASVMEAIGDGGWLRCAAEGWLGYSTVLCYGTYGPDGEAAYASNAWVDGRYVSEYECYVNDVTFADYPEANIILHDVSYTDAYGRDHLNSVTYEYNSDNDTWCAPYYYRCNYWYFENDFSSLPDPLVLTREEVNELLAQGVIDGNTSIPPEAEYIYDGTAEPGTKC